MKKIKLIFVLMLLAGCAQLPLDSTATVTEVAVHPQSTKSTSMPSPTHTMTPALELSTPVLLTPIPPLTSQKDFFDYISITGDGVCKLPCWLTITPGQTEWEDIILAVEPLSSMADIDVRGTNDGKINGVRWAMFGENFRAEGTILNGNNIDSVEMTVIASTSATSNAPSRSLPLPENFNLKSILQTYGVPTMMFFSTELSALEYPQVPLFIVLVYSEQQFAVRYNRTATVKEGVLESCIPSDSFYLFVANSQEKLASLERMEQAPEMGQLTPLFLEPFEKIMTSSIEVFYKDYISSTSECIYIPVDAWQYMLP